MSIETTYTKLLIENYVKEQLAKGILLSAIDIENEIVSLVEDSDLSIPQFLASSYLVQDGEESSVSKHTNTFSTIKQDLRVLYKEMIALTKTSINSLERWDLESKSLEKKLIDLENRIDNLLILTQDTEGYHSIIIDNFTDTSQVDSSSTVAVDLQSSTVEMTSSSEGITRVFLNNLDTNNDINFRVRSTVDMISRIDATGADLKNPFKQNSSSWWTSISTKKAKPITCEMSVRLHPTELVPISKIFMELHDSVESSPMQITPLYSVDNVTWNQLPTNTFTLRTRDTATFSFSEVSAKYVRFLLTKEGPDSGRSNLFSYQFGFKNIAFYQMGFDTDVVQTLITQPLWVATSTGEALEFEKITLDSCERIETDTEIDYFIATSNDYNTFTVASASWVPISPVRRANPKYPTILTVGDTTEVTYGDDEEVLISYDSSTSTTVNPAQTFQLLSLDDNGSIQDDTILVSTPRYTFANSNDRILNYQIKDSDYVGSGSGDNAVTINEDTLIVFRNIGAKGLTSEDLSTKVRGIQRGWKFEDPWYSCVIEIKNPDGITLNVGEKEIVIDDIKYNGTISNLVLTGKTSTTSGIHKIKVNKANWKYVTPELNSLADLKSNDPLYPFNHKLLIEGYDYGDAYPTTESQIYTGVDLFAESQMRQVSVFDIISNVTKNNYDVFALDRDTPNTHLDDLNNNATRVFVVKVDEENPDFQNEHFMIRFSLINQRRKYLRLRADFRTDNEKVTPACTGYKIKLGG